MESESGFASSAERKAIEERLSKDLNAARERFRQAKKEFERLKAATPWTPGQPQPDSVSQARHRAAQACDSRLQEYERTVPSTRQAAQW